MAFQKHEGRAAAEINRSKKGALFGLLIIVKVGGWMSKKDEER